MSILNTAQAQAKICPINKRYPVTEFRQDGLDLTLNEITFLRTAYPELRGSGLNMSIKENLWDTTDIDFKNRVGSLEFGSSHIDMHATNMATIAAGGGNSAPSAKGVAWNATISSADFSNLLPEGDAYFIDHAISVQTHAYGTGIENYYGNESKAFDEIANRIPWLVHVFSSGNSGETTPGDGKFSGLAGWSNLTGQFKQSKNTITAGAVDSFNNVVALSSRGPAFDGRIKPEIVAYGHGGSSGAAAIVAGTSLLLQEKYLDINGEFPPSSLIKAALINTAKDLGNKGPDFISGFGSLKAYDAIRLVEENRFNISEVSQGETIEFPVFIPQQIHQANFSIVWTDPSAGIGAEYSLVNNIDFEVEDDAGKIWFPWLLNTFPHADSLSQSARYGMDTLNTVEKITIDFPSPGNYVLRIKGSRVWGASQQVSTVWDFRRKEDFLWTFPTQQDHLLPDSTNVLRWNTSEEQSGHIDFRMIGEDWAPLGIVDHSTDEFFSWRMPAMEGLGQLRWTSPSDTVLSDTFVIVLPIQPDVALWCSDSLIINWRHHAIFDTTEVFKLGERHLEHYAFVTDTFFTEYDPVLSEKYYAIAPVHNGFRGPLSYTIDFTQQGGGCYLNLFYLLHELNGIATFRAAFSRINEIMQVVLHEKQNGVFIPILFIDGLDSSQISFQSEQLRQGINEFRLTVRLKNGEEILSEIVSVYYAKEHELLFFPNPVTAGQEVTLLTHILDDFELKIFDIQGRIIEHFELTSAPMQIPTLQLHPGIFVVQLISPSGQHKSGLIQIIDDQQ